jgi:uracil-DNA glycosylase
MTSKPADRTKGNVMTSLTKLIPNDWYQILKNEFKQNYWDKLESFVLDEIKEEVVFPSKDEIFSALELTSYSEVKVLLLGQDPYHNYGQAHGLCFSVRNGIKLPPSLKNIYKELYDDLGIPISDCGSLTSWAEHGVLLLNTTLTVRAHQAASHSKIGWTNFTDAVIRVVNGKKTPVIFVLWGGHAAAKEKLIDASRHIIIKSAHPSPLSAYRGFFGSRPFSRINNALELNGYKPISWETQS